MKHAARQMEEQRAWRSLALVALPALALLPLLALQRAADDVSAGAAPPLFTMAQEPPARPKAEALIPAAPVAAPPAPQMAACILPPEPQPAESGPILCGLDALPPDTEPELATDSLPAPRPAPQARPRTVSRTPVPTMAAADAPSTTPPAYLSNPKPPYPAAMRQRRIQGSVGVRIAVSQQGTPTAVDITRPSGHAEFDSTARSWILRHWRFRPATTAGKATASTVTTTVRFRLN